MHHRQRAAGLHVEQLEDRSVPATFYVNTTLDDVTPANGQQSLREAITRANDNPGADVIIVPAGVYKLTVTSALGILDTVTIQGAGRGLTIVDGQQLHRVFDVLGSGPSSIKVVLEGLTVRNGSTTGHGGGIRTGNADLVVRDYAVSGNHASLTGGGISNASIPGSGNVTVVRTIVGRNVAEGDGNGLYGGGGIFVGGNSLLTIRDSTVRRNIASDNGGGISADTAVLTNCTLSGNKAGGYGEAAYGGGLYAATSATLNDCIVSGNTSWNHGGGINAGTVTLTGCTVSGNESGSGGGIYADTVNLSGCAVSVNRAGAVGGIFATSTATLTNCTVSGNSASEGGGGGIGAATANLTNCTISGNYSAVGGGGILAFTAVTLTRCTVSGNIAGDAASDADGGGNGGGILAIMAASLTNCTVSGNQAATNGGGIWATDATLINNTVVENSAHTGGGLFQNPGGAISVRNSIVALNLVNSGGTDPDVSGSFTSAGHNLIGIGSAGAGFTNGVNGDMVGTSVDPIDPTLGALKNNGGRTKTHALLAGSLAIDHGDNAALPPADQRGAGFARLKDGNFDGLAIVDIGAFER